MSSAISFINIRNNKGPNTDPWGTPAKWTKHINTIIERASKQLNILRKLKFKLNRQYLENIYITFIRPILEVWDNCGAVICECLLFE
jgi:hypothetical protein